MRVLFTYMGAPTGPDEVEDFLFRFLYDVRHHIGLDVPGAKEIIRGMAKARARHVRGHYGAIGGKSPLVEHIEEIAKAVSERTGHEIRLGMCYSRPLLEELDWDFDLAFPLYHVYSGSTTERCLIKIRELFGEKPYVKEWWNNEKFIRWIRKNIEKGLQESGFENPYVILSVHSLPRKVVEKGDPYERTHRKLAERVMDVFDLPWEIAFQSKFGRGKWLGPGVPEVLSRLKSEGVKEVLVYPLSFIVENVETLYELDVEYRGVADKLGLKYYRAKLNHRDSLLTEAIAEVIENVGYKN
ncbi:ferrochelatase [Thermococcus waiotapuensis]|uniref:Ferrochelatase n=1 Tax=Thermococcus waiotapuensis TaxID=90909 RepID=A0AAE4NUL3_9EURY|nr:ferrochelatase [Thermococcus waiotapuensis]MDV3103885.1 ferrochelatase [Thermococcus waiotapuensis]